MPNNHRDFSEAIGVAGTDEALQFEPAGSDITAQIEAHHSQIMGGDQIVNLDDQHHTNMRSLMKVLFTPSRLKANEAFFTQYSDELVSQVVNQGSCELIKEVATPFVTPVIADPMDVPPADRQFFMDIIEAAPPPGGLDPSDNDYSGENHPMVVMAGYFAENIVARRKHSRRPQFDPGNA